MNLGVICASIAAGGGGVSVAMREMCRATGVAEPNTKIHVLSVEHPIGDEEIAEWKPATINLYRSFGPVAISYTPGIFRGLIELDIDLVHLHGLWQYPSYATYRWHRSSGKPYIISPHGMLDKWAMGQSRLKKKMVACFFENANLKHTRCIHALNSEEAQAIRDFGLKNPICVIPNGVNCLPSSARRLPSPWGELIPDNSKVLLFLGRLHPKKGLDIMINGLAACGATAADWQIAIAGWGNEDYVKSLLTLIAERNLSNRVHLLGPQFGDQKIACLQHAHAFGLTSFSEGLPVAVLEAWAHSLPVIMTPQCNLPIGFSANGAIKVEANTESVCEGLNLMATMNSADRDSMGANGLKIARENYDWNVIGKQFAELYRWAEGGGAIPDFVQVPDKQNGSEAK